MTVKVRLGHLLPTAENSFAFSRYPRFQALLLLNRAACSLRNQLLRLTRRSSGRRAVAVPQGHLGSPDSHIRARKERRFVEISAIQGVAPADLSRRVTFETRLAQLRDADPCRFSRSSRRSGLGRTYLRPNRAPLVEISVNQVVAPLN